LVGLAIPYEQAGTGLRRLPRPLAEQYDACVRPVTRVVLIRGESVRESAFVVRDLNAVKIRVVGSSVGNGPNHQYLISYLFGDHVAIDAGSIGFISPLHAQTQIRHVFLSHSHIDHTASLATFLDNVYVPGPECVSVYGNPETLDSLRSDLFNDRLWPDLVRLSVAESPFLTMLPLSSEQAVEVEGLRVLPVVLDHVVPTFGFIVSDHRAAVAIVSDTAPTERIWELVNQTPNLKAVLVEVSFPNDMAWLAEKAKHLTTALFVAELKKLQQAVPVIAVHIKPRYQEQVVAELAAAGLANVQIGEPEHIYTF
jgi:ribonuclease BN (tRNA processing enzyme)